MTSQVPAVRISLGDLAQHVPRRPSRRPHLDGCHYYVQAFDCDACGGHLEVTTERDPTHDAGDRAWLLEGCGRCMDLADGAKRRAVRVYYRPGFTDDGYPRHPCHIAIHAPP